MIVSETRPSGLIVARDSMDEEAVSRAIKRLDGRLVLQKHARDGVEGGWVYKVICFVSDNYAPVVLTWNDEYGRPLPLSSGIIDKLQSLYLDARNKPISADEHNQRLVEEHERVRQAQADAVIEDHRAYVERGRVSVSIADTKKLPYWQREGRPKSGGSVG